jgi:hypothetical protein
MKRVLCVVLWICTAAMVCSAQTTFYFPHVVDGPLGTETWKTTIFLTNPSSSVPASGTITLMQQSGSLNLAGLSWPGISFTDESKVTITGGTIAFSIAPGQIKKYISSGVEPPPPGAPPTLVSGFATVVANGSVSGTAVFSRLDAAGNLIAEAGVPAATAASRQSIFVDTVGGFSVGIAYANPGPAAANITLSLFNAAAAQVDTTTQTLGAGNHSAGFTSDFFTRFTDQLSGSMQITSSVALPVIALRFAKPPSEVYTTLPPVTLSSLISPAMEWFQGRPWLSPLSSVARLLGTLDRRLI